jgi:acyl carrier protein
MVLSVSLPQYRKVLMAVNPSQFGGGRYILSEVISAMTESVLRELVVSSLEDANVSAFPNNEARQAFIDGRSDLNFEDIEIDSLGLMQFCIAIESRSGVSIAPRELARFRSLGEVVHELLLETR